MSERLRVGKPGRVGNEASIQLKPSMRLLTDDEWLGLLSHCAKRSNDGSSITLWPNNDGARITLTNNYVWSLSGGISKRLLEYDLWGEKFRILNYKGHDAAYLVQTPDK